MREENWGHCEFQTFPYINLQTVSNLIEKADFEIIGFEAINTGEISPEEDVNVDIQVKLKKLKVDFT